MGVGGGGFGRIGWGLFFVCWGVKRSGVESSGVSYADVWVLMGHSRSMPSSPASAPRSGSLSSRPVCGSRRIRRTRWSLGASVMSGEFSDIYTHNSLSLSIYFLSMVVGQGKIYWLMEIPNATGRLQTLCSGA